MGTFTRKIVIGDLDDPARCVEADALVDTGSLYTWLPAERLDAIGLRPTEQVDFTIATGECVRRGVCEARIRLDGRERTTIVVFGDAGCVPLLGAYAIEGFGLTVDAPNRRLVPAPALPAC